MRFTNPMLATTRSPQKSIDVFHRNILEAHPAV